MNRTLFWYVFRDLLRIFFLASGALAGIMSFGGLLRPLTEHGLSAAQVGQMLTYFSPAMTTYSFPVAAVFATTMVYGRLSSDNELTACRACGISYLSMTAPALVLGLVVSIVSLGFLCFIVPVFTLKVEKTIYSNLAQLIQNQIERTHQLKFDQMNVFADAALVLPPTPAELEDKVQHVALVAPMIITYTTLDNPNPALRMKRPVNFTVGSRADVYLKQKGDAVEFTGFMSKGSRLPRELRGGSQMSFDNVQFGPFKFPSPIREDTKFMNIRQLKSLFTQPEQSSRLRDEVHEIIASTMRSTYLDQIRQSLADQGQIRFVAEKRSFTLIRGDLRVLENRKGVLELISSMPQARQARLDSEGIDEEPASRKAVYMQLRVDPVFSNDPIDDPVDYKNPRMVVHIDAYDLEVAADEDPAEHRSYPYEISIPMPPSQSELRQLTIKQVLNAPVTGVSPQERSKLNTDRRRLLSKITGEIHGRAAFAVSCLVLVLVGCCLGMMFRSGNFLSAFAVSFVPAMLGIALIVTGQQICGNSPSQTDMGIAFIWSGNVAVSIISLVLLTRLQRQ